MLHLRDIGQYIIGRFKSQQKDTFCQGSLNQDKVFKRKNVNIVIIEDILSFPKSHSSPPKDENWEIYDQFMLGNFEKMHEIQIEQS